ncbi:phage tail tip lysozyme [Seohaeicola zhoushanensis]
MTQTALPDLTGQPGAAEADPGFWETAGAAWRAETVRTDAWSYSARVRDQLFMSIYDRLDDAAKERVWNYRQRNINDAAGQETMLLNEAGKLRSAGDPAWEGLPATRDEMTAEVNRRRRDVLDDAEAVMDAGSGLAGFLGGSARAMTDPISLAMAPLGAGGALWKITAREALLGAAGEALVLPREFEVAEDLDLPTPAVLPRLATGAAAGGLLGLTFAGAERLVRYAVGRKAVTRESRPDGVSEIEHSDEIEARRHEMEFGPGAEIERPAAGTLGDLLRMGDFDFSRSGNASPITNRIGYVYGRLLERGMEPHIAAGFVGNFMAESGAGLNTRAVGDGGNAFGIAQWNGPRRHAYLDFASRAGKDPGDLDTQIDFVMHELATTEAGAMAKISQASDARQAAALVSQYYERPGTPHLPRRVAYASHIAQQHEAGSVPRWDGAVSTSAEGTTTFTGYGTSRGYTGTGQVAVGDTMRVDVEYEVVDASLLRRASGDLQPRDRSRVASDAWVSDTAARLDPALLMPAPTADRGAPLIGPDNVIESGNGRFAAIERAYDRHPDRADAYRRQIEATTGAPIPEGIERPVLVARRTSELDDAARRQLVVEAQDSGVARMTAAERARVGTRALNADLLGRLDPATKLSAASNRDFARDFAGHFPRAERNAFVGPDGRISADGIRQIQDSLFARAWDAPDIVARALEAEPGELKGLLDALASAAPDVAMLRADIDAGLVRPEMDITPFILDAVRLIVTARDLAERGGQVAELLEELLAEVDLLDGAVAPLTQALVRLFAPNGRQAPFAKIADFLRRYAAEARKAGQTGDALLDPPSPLDVLKRIAPDAFGDLTEMGAARAMAREPEVQDLPDSAYNDGAASPEAEAAADLAEQELAAIALAAGHGRGRGSEGAGSAAEAGPAGQDHGRHLCPGARGSGLPGAPGQVDRGRAGRDLQGSRLQEARDGRREDGPQAILARQSDH